MGLVLAIAAAFVYGAADFAGGMMSKRTTTWSVVIVSQIAGFATLLIVFPFLHQSAPVATDFEWGASAGICGAAAAALLYRGLAVGRMSVVSPITAVLGAALPVVWGMFRGERPSTGALIGIALALVAVVLVSSISGEADLETPKHRLAPGIPEALFSGLGFGAFFVLIAQTSAHAGMWPLIGARLVSIPFFLLCALAARSAFLPARGSALGIGLCGVLDMGANVLYLLSTRYALLAIAAVVTSLYPASTVLLARVVLKERLNARQWSGVMCAAAGIVLIALR